MASFERTYTDQISDDGQKNEQSQPLMPDGSVKPTWTRRTMKAGNLTLVQCCFNFMWTVLLLLMTTLLLIRDKEHEPASREWHETDICK
jgi:hypothetical protein